MLWSVAYAQEAAASAPAAKPGMLETFFPLIIAFVVIYFFILRPQNKRAKDQQTMQSSLKRGDQVVTSSGILGTIEGLTDQFITLEVAQGVKMKVQRRHVQGLHKENT